MSEETGGSPGYRTEIGGAIRGDGGLLYSVGFGVPDWTGGSYVAPPTIPPPPEGTVDNEMAKLVGEFNRLVDFIVNYGFGGPGADREWAELVRKEMRVAHYLVGLCIELGPSGGVHRRMLADEMRVVRWKMKKANDEEQAALLAAAGAEATARGYPEGARPRGK